VLAGVLLATARNNPGHRHRPPANSRLASQLADLLDAVDEIRPGSLVVMMMMTTTVLSEEKRSVSRSSVPLRLWNHGACLR